MPKARPGDQYPWPRPAAAPASWREARWSRSSGVERSPERIKGGGGWSVMWRFLGAGSTWCILGKVTNPALISKIEELPKLEVFPVTRHG